MNTKGVNEIIVMAILILILIVAIGLLIMFIGPFFDELEDSEIINKTCFSKWECGNWTDCEIHYSVRDALTGVVLTGTKMRGCSDINGCESAKIEIEGCDTGGLVSVNKISRGSGDYLEIRNESGSLISEVKIIGGAVYINLIIDS
ncbi:MAG: hypothetical protein Q8N63_06280 [Nanoarchaeota archaeon]|nr:hypothetical protein [Nanoarchaeota archaeon]